MPKEQPLIKVDNSTWPPGSEQVVEFAKAWKSSKPNTQRTRTRFYMPGTYVEPPPPVEPPPSSDPQWMVDLRKRQRDHWAAVQVVTTVSAPSTIPHDGATASSAALQGWLDHQASGPSDHEIIAYDLSTIGGTLRLEGTDVSGIDLRGKSNYVLRLPPNGLIRQTDSTGSTERQAFLIGNGGTAWVDMQQCAVDSENPLVGNPANIDIGRSFAQVRSGALWTRISNGRALRQWGFGPWCSSSGGSTSPEDIWFDHLYVQGGQMGLGMVGGKRAWFDHCTLKDTMRIAMDIEPDAPGDAVEDILFDAIIADGWGNDPNFSSWWASSCPSGNAETVPMKRVGWVDCVSTRGPKDPKNGNYAGIGGLAFRGDDPNPKEDFYFLRNRTDVRHVRTDEVMRFKNMKNLTVTNNTQPIQPPALLIKDEGGSGTRVLTPNQTT